MCEPTSQKSGEGSLCFHELFLLSFVRGLLVPALHLPPGTNHWVTLEFFVSEKPKARFFGKPPRLTQLPPEALFIYLFLIYLLLFMAVPVAHGSSQARGQIRAIAESQPRSRPQPQQHQIQAMSATYAAVHSDARSLTHWVRPGIEPAPSWRLVGFVTHWATMGTSASWGLTTKLLRWYWWRWYCHDLWITGCEHFYYESAYVIRNTACLCSVLI